MIRPKVNIEDMIEGIELSRDECQAYLDLHTGRIEYIDEQTSWALSHDDDESLPDWQRPLVEITRLIEADEEGERFWSLPNRFDVDEWQMMAEFAAAAKDDAVRDELSCACRGSGAFRRFKDAVHRLGLAHEWHTWRNEGYRQVAIDWCEANEIPWEPHTAAGADSTA
ncbi:MAG: hypothetical protein KGY81_06840 [Phycisphaerae bacterium]|nr:hypothetical protein [Phycisphaerae bacterium]